MLGGELWVRTGCVECLRDRGRGCFSTTLNRERVSLERYVYLLIHLCLHFVGPLGVVIFLCFTPASFLRVSRLSRFSHLLPGPEFDFEVPSQSTSIGSSRPLGRPCVPYRVVRESIHSSTGQSRLDSPFLLVSSTSLPNLLESVVNPQI